jgi:hypothetical protein
MIIRKSSDGVGWLAEGSRNGKIIYLSRNLEWVIYTGYNYNEILFATDKEVREALRSLEHLDKLGENKV